MEKSSPMKTMKTLLTLPFILSGVAMAQDYQLDDIEVSTVRSNKDDKKFIETTESISVLKPKSLNRGDLNNSVQMLNGLANVQAQEDKAGTTFSIRGISDTGVTGFQKDNLASVLVDDVFQTGLALRAGSFENWDLETIEVLRGAQSTSQGVNSLAGNILLYHTKAHTENEGAAKLTFGNFGRKEGAFMVNRKVNDKFAVRLGYNKEYTDGYIKNTVTNNDKWGQRNKDHLNTDFTYKLSGSDELHFNFKILRMHQGGQYVQGNDPWDYKVFEDQDYNAITNNHQASLVYDKDLKGGLSNKMILAYSGATSTTKSDADGQATNIAGKRHDNENDQFMSFENQLKYKSDKVKNVLGLHIHRFELNRDYNFRMILGPNPPGPYPVIQEDQRIRKTYAIFNSFNYDFNQNHAITLGGRLEIVENEFGTNILTTVPSTTNVNTDNEKQNFVALPKLGYTFSQGHYSLGALYSQGYRTGGISVNRFQNNTNSYTPEKTHNYELSYKYQKQKFLFASNLFYTKWNDQQVEIAAIGNPLDTQVRNAASSELYGAEVESSYEFQNADSFRFNMGYVKTRFLNFKSGNTNFTGNEFPEAADFTGQASYWKVFSESWKGILVGRYVGESYGDAQNRRNSPSQFYLDTNLQYSFSSYLLELYVKNVFNQKYRVYNGFATSASYPSSYHRMNPPREFGARLNYYW